MNALHKLLRPRSIAVIGASADPEKTSGKPVHYLLKHGFDGKVFPVNPKAGEINGLVCYANIASLPEAPDVAIVLLGASRTQQAIRELAAIGTGAAIVVASGYSETGSDGAQRQAELLQAAGAMRILGPNTIGLVNLTDRITLSASGALASDELCDGCIGLISQSGGILGALLSRASARGIGFSKLISTSNEVDLDLADFVDVLADDPATRVIALYVESIRRPAAFRAAARKAAALGKPIVAYKVGRSASGAQAAASHTGAMAGADASYDALFAEVGIHRARSFSDLLDVPLALSAGRRLQGNRIAVLTSTGGAGTLVADSLGLEGFELPGPDTRTSAALLALQQGDHAALDRNPIDVTLAGLQPGLLRSAIRIALQSDGYDALVVVVGSSAVAQPALMAEALRDSLSLSDKPLLAYISPHAPQAAALLSQYGIAAFTSPESIGAAFSAMRAKSTFQPTAAGQSVDRRRPVTWDPEMTGSLDEAQAKNLFAQFGIPGVAEVVVRNAQDAEAAARSLGPRVVLKILSRDITHKSDVGGVAVNVPVAGIAARISDMSGEVARRSGINPEGFLLQEMVHDAEEVIVGLHRDSLGAAILIGMGGVLAELIHDTTVLLLPEDGTALSAAQVEAGLKQLKTWPLLNGYRGRPAADVAALIDAVLAFAGMVTTLGDRLVEAEINPLFVKAWGQGVSAADGVVILQSQASG